MGRRDETSIVEAFVDSSKAIYVGHWSQFGVESVRGDILKMIVVCMFGV